MDNDPELQAKGRFLGTITSDFVQIADHLREAAYAIRDRELSKFPIFVFAREPVALGALLFGAQERDLKWYVYAATLEEFTQRGLVEVGEGEAAFQSAYKNPDEYACLFVVDPSFMEFVFLPYPED
ncbi:MAG: hypothetical protein H7330_00200 [Hymenobacteraceae bacterium]|nr:hypothetical protein [Hymenobacteraceae bacterium]